MLSFATKNTIKKLAEAFNKISLLETEIKKEIRIFRKGSDVIFYCSKLLSPIALSIIYWLYLELINENNDTVIIQGFLVSLLIALGETIRFEAEMHSAFSKAVTNYNKHDPF